MVLIEWHDEFNLGVPSIDHEHRELIELINETFELVKQNDSKVTLLDFLGEIYARISSHFALEEKIMREKKYDQYDDHKADHERLLDDIRNIMDECEYDNTFDENLFSERLSLWFSNHFKTRDARFHRYLG